MARLLIISAELTGTRMAGPAGRAVELALALSSEFEVTLAAPGESTVPPGYDLELRRYDPDHPRSFASALTGSDAALAPPLAPALASVLHRAGVPWIADLVNPEPFEGLEFGRGLPALRRRAHETLRADRLAFAARGAAAFVCAHERQRDMWLGFLAAHRRLDGSRYASDRTLERLLALVPNGISATPPSPAEPPALRGVQVPADSLIAIWNGGLWDWLDPLTVIEAIAILRARDPRWALVFLGSERPAGPRHMTMHERARALAAERGMLDMRAVHFEPGWTAYNERGARLLEADVGVCAHPASAEIRFAARTRMLDLVWAGLPAVASRGDEWSERIDAEGLGVTVPPGNVEGFADALVATVADRGAYREPLTAAAAQRTWERVIAPVPGILESVLDRGPVRLGATARAAGLRHHAAATSARAVGAARPRRRY